MLGTITIPTKTPSLQWKSTNLHIEDVPQVLNHNQQRSQSTKSKASSMDYADRMQTQNHQLWANQLEEKKQDIPSQVNVPHVHNEANLSTP